MHCESQHSVCAGAALGNWEGQQRSGVALARGLWGRCRQGLLFRGTAGNVGSGDTRVHASNTFDFFISFG